MDNPKNILDMVSADTRKLWIPSDNRPKPTHPRKCSHGYTTSIQRIDMVSSIPSYIYNRMVTEMHGQGQACFMEFYKDTIDEWAKDLTACYGLCHTFICKTLAYQKDGYYYCEQCYRTREV